MMNRSDTRSGYWRPACAALCGFALFLLSIHRGECFDSTELKDWRIHGDVSLDGTFSHSGHGSSIRVSGGGTAVKMLRSENGSGKVSFWVYDDLSADTAHLRNGPEWGVVQADGSVIFAGVVFNPRLSGTSEYYLGQTGLTAGWVSKRLTMVHWSGLQRKEGWSKWEFIFDAKKGVTVVKDGVPVDFTMAETAGGFCGIAILGESLFASHFQQTIWVDEITTELGGPMNVTAPPPPPPSDVMAFGCRNVYLAASQPAPSASPKKTDAPLGVPDTVYWVKTDGHGGSGFLSMMDGKPYVVTNYHVVRGARKIEFRNQKAKFGPSGGPIEVADDRDLVRFPVDQTGGLEINTNPMLDMGVTSYNTTGDNSPPDQMQGKVLGLGPADVEVSCKVDPDSTGGPIVDDGGKVVGVVAYVDKETDVPDWVKKGTRFEGSRQFGVRISNGIKWTAMDYAEFQKETGELLNLYNLYYDYVDMVKSMAKNPYRDELKVKYATGEDVANFVKDYNRQCERFHKGGAMAFTADGIDREFRAKLRAHLATLEQIIQSTTIGLSSRYQRTFTVPLTKSEFASIISDFDDMSDFIKNRSDAIVTTSSFRHKNGE